ncbi:MAG: ABC transporter permease [Thermoanaerobaculia bacterium]|nr:Macrolide export ATP-binding/permease protein MacB [Thermoanaerobaculia bacterium]MCK6682865.1 ABC transporter permease [Thermoanaerobaculia bacterium]
MRGFDLLSLASSAILAHRLRSFLSVLGIVVGITSVVLLTSLGEGTRATVMSEFTSFGTNIISIQPGKFRTTGLPTQAGGTIRRLTIADSEALRRVPGVQSLVPVLFGMARVQAGIRARSIFVMGVTAEMQEVWSLRRARVGRFLPPGDPERPQQVAAIGTKVAEELFDGSPLGQRLRIADQRFLVVGVMEAKGNMLGFDVDDVVYIPTASAQRLFARDELAGIDVKFDPRVPVEEVVTGIRRLLLDRHRGEEDFTILTQTEMLGVLDRVLSVVGVAVAGIGGISLLVGAIGILTIMWISVGERTSEIGLILALGGQKGQIVALFLLESALLALAGGVLGVGLAFGLSEGLKALVPGLPFRTPAEMVVGAPLFCLLAGILAGVLPARRAAALDPVSALRAE